MSDTGWAYAVRFWSSAIITGIVAGIILTTAIMLGAYSVPEPVANTVGIAGRVVFIWIVTASVLATAPLVGWWYNFLTRLFGFSLER